MSEDKPLHVRVAEAVSGLPACACGPGDDSYDGETGLCLRCGNRAPLRYDTDWSATGPLIEKYGIGLGVGIPGDFGQDGFVWWAMVEADNRSPLPEAHDRRGLGATPLEAICHLILALSEAGKLQRENP